MFQKAEKERSDKEKSENTLLVEEDKEDQLEKKLVVPEGGGDMAA